MKNLILLGGGGHCKSVIDVAETAGYNIIGILDPNLPIGETILGYPVLGKDDLIDRYARDVAFVITVGQIKNPLIRKKLYELVIKSGAHLATIIAPTAHVSKYASIGEGTVVMHYAMVNANTSIGKGCIINTYANIEHDCQIGHFCHISTGAMVNGECRIGDDTFIGSQSVISNNVIVDSGCVIAVGTVIRKNVQIKGIYSGNPGMLKIKI